MPEMRTFDGPGGGARSDALPAQVIDMVRRETLARLLPLLGDTLRGERARLTALQADGQAPEGTAESLRNLTVLAAELIEHEQRWQKSISAVFATWPHAPVARARSGFSLVSDDELQAQLIGQPVAESLDKRFAYIRDVIDKRLWSLAAQLQFGRRPTNPLAAQHIVEAFLAAFTVQDCDPGLRRSLLRCYEALLETHLGALYDWCNTRLADTGHAMASGNDHASLVAGGHTPTWSRDNAIAQSGASWQRNTAGAAPSGDGPRGALLRTHARRVRTAAHAERTVPARLFRQEEFMSTLGLLQADRQLPGPGARHATRMRAGLYAVASQLGIEQRDVGLTPDQDDAIDLVGRLFDTLVAGYLLSDAAQQRLAILTLPYLYLALDDPRLFDDPPPPAMELLGQLLSLWDGAADDDESHALADRVADAAVTAAHGDSGVFARGLAQIDAGVTPVRRRAEANERRTWQAIRGRERLGVARRDADAALRACLDGRPVTDAVATFLDAQWRQALVQIWLRDGPTSPRYDEVRGLGDALVGTDSLAASAAGAEVADRLLAILPALRTCCQQCALDDAALEEQIAALVSALASPAVARRSHDIIALAGSDALLDAVGDSDGNDAMEEDDRSFNLVEGQRFVQTADEGAGRQLRLAWRSPLTGACLLVNASGGKERLLAPHALRAMIRDGSLQPRPSGGAVAAALLEMAGRARSSG